MNLTFSFEWEMFLIDEEKGTPLKADRVRKIKNLMQFSQPWARHGLDFHHRVNTRLLEVRPGIISSYSELVDSVNKIKAELNRLSKREKFLPIVSGTVPVAGGVMGLHIHIGTIHSIHKIEKRIREILYLVPVWAGISVSSPVYPDTNDGQFKSTRIWENAEWTSLPNQNTSIGVHQWQWGTDIMDSGIEKPTIQIRIPDAPLSTEFLKEFVIFVVGLVSSGISYELTEDRYMNYILNRYNAAKHGLQATFRWLGKEKPLSEIIEELLPIAIESAKSLGYKEHFPLLTEMAKKHISQADFVLAIHSTTTDKWATTFEIGKLLRSEPDPFVEFVHTSSAIPVKPFISEEDVVLSNIVKATPLSYLANHTFIPVVRLHSIIQNLIKDGKIKEYRYKEFPPLYMRNSSDQS